MDAASLLGLDHAGRSNDGTTLLLETDSEPGDRILLQTDSECEDCPSPEHHTELLLATDSEGEVHQPPKKRRYVANRAGSRQLKFLGKEVCQAAHKRLYGIGSGALQKLRQGERPFTMHQGRLEEPKHPTVSTSLVRSSLQRKWPSVLSFFWMLYISCAEVLPTNFIMPTTLVGHLAETVVKSDPDFQERYVSAFMRTLESNYATDACLSRMMPFTFIDLFASYLVVQYIVFWYFGFCALLRHNLEVDRAHSLVQRGG